VELAPRDLARLDDSDRRVDRCAGDRDLLGGTNFRVGVEPTLSTTIRTAWMKPPSSNFCIGPDNALSGVSPKPMTWRTTSGAS